MKVKSSFGSLLWYWEIEDILLAFKGRKLCIDRPILRTWVCRLTCYQTVCHFKNMADDVPGVRVYLVAWQLFSFSSPCSIDFCVQQRWSWDRGIVLEWSVSEVHAC
jgi:hypothetical protein